METKKKNLSGKTKVFLKNDNLLILAQKDLARKLSSKISSLHIHIASLFYPDLDPNSIRLFLRTINNIRSCLKSFYKKHTENFQKNHQKTSNLTFPKTSSSKDIVAQNQNIRYLSQFFKKVLIL